MYLSTFGWTYLRNNWILQFAEGKSEAFVKGKGAKNEPSF